MPTPVMTTRLINRSSPRRLGRPIGSGLVLLDELDRVADRQDGLGGIIGNLDAKLFLESHDELDRIEAVGAQIVDEARVVRDLLLLDAQVLDDDLLHSLSGIAHCQSSIAIGFAAFVRRGTTHYQALWSSSSRPVRRQRQRKIRSAGA